MGKPGITGPRRSNSEERPPRGPLNKRWLPTPLATHLPGTSGGSTVANLLDPAATGSRLYGARGKQAGQEASRGGKHRQHHVAGGRRAVIKVLDGTGGDKGKGEESSYENYGEGGDYGTS